MFRANTINLYVALQLPPYSVGEVKRWVPSADVKSDMDIWQNSLAPVLPDEKSFPIQSVLYLKLWSLTVHLQCKCLRFIAFTYGCRGSLEISCCRGCGINKEGDRVAILTDISGTEDHVGDMDFKVAGTG